MSERDKDLVDGPEEAARREREREMLRANAKLRYADEDGTPQTATAGGAIISGHGDQVPDQTAGGLILEGDGDLVDAEAEGGDIVEGHGERVPDPADGPHRATGQKRTRVVEEDDVRVVDETDTRR